MLETNKINNERMKLADDLFLYKLDESLAWLFSIENGEYYKLNDSSHFILSLFDGKKTIGEIQKIYINKYFKEGIGEPILLKDFNELLERMMRDNILINLNR
ncbi:MAG: PqqD family protein [Thermoplasmata archaeon]|nr:PqqD family protein [Thermoplasmata archaeon]